MTLQETADFFGLDRMPQAVGIDRTPQLVSAEQNVFYAVHQGLGLVPVMGPSGVGKSYLGNRLESLLKTDSAYLVARSDAPAKELLLFGVLLSDVLHGFNLKDRQKLTNRFTEIKTFLHANTDKRALLIIDSAEKLSHKLLAELRSLMDLEIATEESSRRLLTIILLGLPKLRWTLRLGALETVAYRATEIWVEPLGRYFDSFLDWLLIQCGGDIEIVSAKAREALQFYYPTPGQLKSGLWVALQDACHKGDEVVFEDHVHNSCIRQPTDELALMNRLGITTQDVAREAGVRWTVAERVMRDIYQGRKDVKTRVLTAAHRILEVCKSPLSAPSEPISLLSPSEQTQGDAKSPSSVEGKSALPSRRLQ